MAARLGWRFVDLDVEIARMAGRSISDIFRELGEAEFRRMEREATAELARDDERLVLAPGGGWMSNAGARAALGGGAMVIYLAVTPATAARRLGVDALVRPLLAADPVGGLNALLANRESVYRTADRTVETEHLTLQQVIESVTQLATAS